MVILVRFAVNMTHFLFTSESVTIGHPDKIADQISDSILDACLSIDPNARVACETLVTKGLVVLAGEITINPLIDYQEIVRKTIREIGYENSQLGFDAQSCGIICSIHQQSPDIAQGVNELQNAYHEQGAGDQGIMFGFACDETFELMPLPIMIAHQIVRKLRIKRQEGILKYLRPDGKAQVTVEYDEFHQPVRIHTIVISTQHSEDVDQAEIVKDMKAMVKEIVPSSLLDENTLYYINPTGRFVVGGPSGDTGLTGRKIIVDSYGGMGRHGGGAFSGKDPSKVDRSATYAARYIAKNIVAAKLAKRCEVQLSYAIGIPHPISIKIDTFGTGAVSEDLLRHTIPLVFQLTPKGIIKMLDLNRPIYRQTAYEGHFGRTEPAFTWEKTDKVEALLNAIKQESFLVSHLPSSTDLPLNINEQDLPEGESAFQQEKKTLSTHLAKEISSLGKKEKILRNHLKKCISWEGVKHEGDLIKFHLGKIKKGIASATLEDWETGQSIKLEIDPRKTPQDAMTARYKQAKKLQRGQEVVLKQLELTQERLQLLRDQIEQIEKIQTQSEWENIKKSISIPFLLQTAQKSIAPASTVYREYQSECGVKIWVGKNAKSNEKLTFQLANGRDWWLHVRGSSGSHVIIRMDRDEEPDFETLREAMQLALYYSKARNQEEGEVCYTQRKYVARLGRGKAGLAQVSKHRTAWVRLDKDLIQKIKRSVRTR